MPARRPYLDHLPLPVPLCILADYNLQLHLLQVKRALDIPLHTTHMAHMPHAAEMKQQMQRQGCKDCRPTKERR